VRATYLQPGTQCIQSLIVGSYGPDSGSGPALESVCSFLGDRAAGWGCGSERAPEATCSAVVGVPERQFRRVQENVGGVLPVLGGGPCPPGVLCICCGKYLFFVRDLLRINCNKIVKLLRPDDGGGKQL
jgi:hypothetical protein